MIRFFRKQSNKTALMPPDGYTAARSGDALIAQEYLQPYLHEIRTLVALPSPHFSQLYLSPITRYLALTQHCQREAIEQHLQVIINGLKQRRALLLPSGVTPEAISQQKDLWTYVVFALLLLHNAADHVNGYALVVKKPEEQDYLARQWCPFNVPLSPPYRFKVVGQITVSPYASVALLPQLLTPDCLAWLYSDNEAINAVLTLLGAPATESPLGTLLMNAVKASGKPSKKKAVIQPVVDKRSPPKVPIKSSTQSLGQEFYHWLVVQRMNQDDSREVITQTSEGWALLCPDIFRRFLTDCSDPSRLANWEDVQKAFLALKHHQINPATKKAFHQSQWPGRGACRVIIIPAPPKK